MWRRCDLHNHTTPNEQDESELDAAQFVEEALDRGLDVVAVTDHDHVDRVSIVVAAAEETSLTVVPGLEVTTDSGHVIVLAPDEDGLDCLRNLIARLGIRRGGEIPFTRLVEVVKTDDGPDGCPFGTRLLLIGAHTDQPGSMLMPSQPPGLASQLSRAAEMDALEVVNDETRHQWNVSGVKASAMYRPLLRSSDHHVAGERRQFHSWLYLPTTDCLGFRQAFATHDAAISATDDSPVECEYWLRSIEIRGGSHHDGMVFDFSPRTNVVIGPPGSGKSLLIDAIRFLFDSSSDVETVEATRRSRIAACLPGGSSVHAVLRTPSGDVQVERTVGGEAKPTLPFSPIIFSQNELVHRSMAEMAHISLLDAHCPESLEFKKKLAVLGSEVEVKFQEASALATSIAELGRTLSNPVDGLEATHARVRELAGSEDIAQSANSLSRVKGWRSEARESIKSWLLNAGPPGSLGLPPIPELTEPEWGLLADDDGLGVVAAPAVLLPVEAISERFMRLTDEIRRAVSAAADEATTLLDEAEADLDRASEIASAAIADGDTAGAEHLVALEEARARLANLERQDAERKRLTDQLTEARTRLENLVDTIGSTVDELRAARGSGCARVNSSIKGFRVRLDRGVEVEELTALLDSVKTGTYMREDAISRVRDQLDRRRVIRCALGILSEVPVPAVEEFADQDTLVKNAIERSMAEVVARISARLAGDALIVESTGPGEPSQFGQLTEGLRALAIKEISFASGGLPVISDQPEDAVPTQSVYDLLVPTLRGQRGTRQFILVSHDANIVVGGDTDRVIALSSNDDQVSTGCLFEEEIRSAALSLLEGGAAAFQQRQERYGPLVS